MSTCCIGSRVHKLAQEQKLHAKTRELFSDLYHVITALHRESETLEFIVADGFIRDSQNPDVHHPVLTRCVSSGHGCRLRQKRVAIECDGERWHSGEAKIREDMERQTILERLGWRFIRIRGSEYYRDAEQTMQRVMQELTDFEIMPEETQEFAPGTRDTELLQRVKTRAHALMQKREQPDLIDVETIRAALQA